MTSMKAAWQQDLLDITGTPVRRSSRLRRHRGKIALALLLIGLAGAGGGYYYKTKIAAAPAPAAASKTVSALTVTVVPVQKGTMPHSLMVTGSLAAFDELPIGTETSGLALSQVLVDIGDHVSKGQLLARFNDEILKAQVLQAQAALKEAEANELEATNNVRRAEELKRTGWMSGQDYDNRRQLASTMEARVGVAKANLVLAEAKLKQTEVRAPTDGTVTSRSAHLGAVMLNGEMFRMIRDDRVELIAELPEHELQQVHAGQKVQLAVEGGKLATTGTVRLVEPTVDLKTRIGKVRITIDRNGDLLPGMFVNGRITTGETEALIAPEKTVIYFDGKPAVFVVDESGKVALHSVTLGPRANEQIALISGVKEGDKLALRGASYLKDGYQVTVVDEAAAAGK